jgi:phosphopantetheinyl transferase (holo-ACP synthase)
MLRGYSKKNRKLRRKKRSAKRFGSPPEIHYNATKSAAKSFLVTSRLVRRWAKQEACYNAWKYFGVANWHAGMAQAHARSLPAYARERGAKGRPRGEYSNKIDRLLDIVQRACPVRTG